MKKLHNVPDFAHVYTVHDKNDNSIHGGFETLDDVAAFLVDYTKKYPLGYDKILQVTKKCDSIVRECQIARKVSFEHKDRSGLYRWQAYGPHYTYDYRYEYYKGIHVTDSLGDVVQNIGDIKAKISKLRYRYHSRWSHDDWRKKIDAIEARLVPHHGNVDRIKPVHQHRHCYSYSGDGYDSYASYNSRPIKTYHIHKAMAGICKDEGEPEFRGRCRNIPNTWDDRGNTLWDVRKSWKHNSKRRKQWKEKPSTAV